MKISCPTCKTILGASHLNVATDVAACPNCNEVFLISELVSAGQEVDDGFDIHDPPKGVSFQDTGTGWQLSASTRSSAALFLVPFMCIWSGGSLGSIYGSQIVSGKFDLKASLFGIPFLLGTLVLGSAAVMTVCGRMVVSVDGTEGRVFTGVGPLGWTRRFDWLAITQVEPDYSGYHDSGKNGFSISLIAPTCLKFGRGLNETRKRYVLRALQKLLATRGK